MTDHATHDAAHPDNSCRQCLGQPYRIYLHEGESGTAGTYLGRCPAGDGAINYGSAYAVEGCLAWHRGCAPSYVPQEPEYVAPSLVESEPEDPERLRKLFRPSTEQPVDMRRQLRR